MTITIVTGPFYPLPPGPAGSVEKIWAKLAEKFAERGHSVTILSRKYKSLPARDIQKALTVIRKTAFSRTGLRPADLLLEAIYAGIIAVSLPKSDVIVTNTIFLPILTPLLTKRVGKTVVSVERFPKGQLWCYSRCARLRTTSNAVHDAAIDECPALEQRIKKIPNPVDVAVFTEPVTPRGPASRGTIVYAGRIHPEKGLATLVRAFRLVNNKYPETKLTLAGPQELSRGGGGRDYVAEITCLGEGLPVSLVPNLDNPADLAELLRRANLFCYPSIAEKGESFPVAPLEAMATGLPSVLSRLPVFQDLLEEGQTGLTFNHKCDAPHEDLAAKLLRLIEDDSLRDAIAQRAAIRARDFGYEKIAEAFLNDFNALTGNANQA